MLALAASLALPWSAEGETPGENNWREFLKLTVSIVTRSITFVGFNTFIPLYWVAFFGQSTATGAIALTFFSVCGVISNFFGGMLADKFGYRTVIRAVFALMPPVVAGFSLSNNLYAAWALLPLLGFVLYAPFSAQVVLGQQYGKKYRLCIGYYLWAGHQPWRRGGPCLAGLPTITVWYCLIFFKISSF